MRRILLPRLHLCACCFLALVSQPTSTFGGNRIALHTLWLRVPADEFHAQFEEADTGEPGDATPTRRSWPIDSAGHFVAIAGVWILSRADDRKLFAKCLSGVSVGFHQRQVIRCDFD